MGHRVARALSVALLAAVVGLLLWVPSTALAWAGPAVRVGGEVATPATYSLSQLAALPNSTYTVHRPEPGGGTVPVQGVNLESLVERSNPVLPAAKNALLRVTVTVQGAAGKRVAFALGELDPNFGNHPAVLALVVGVRHLRAAALVVPGDTSPRRRIDQVSAVTVGVVGATPSAPPPGAVDVRFGSRQVVLRAQELSRLPVAALTVTFIAGATSETDTEQGPPLAEVLEAAQVPIGPTTWVAAVGSDGYVATVTPAEAFVGGRPLLLSRVENGAPLTQPRLVADGDVKGGRYVSLVVDLVAGQGGD